MKKTYISPESLTVQLRPMSILMGSNPDVTMDLSGDGVTPGSFETKEVISDVNVWDNEW